MVFFNINICRNNLEDVRQFTEYARAHRVATDYHINETPMLEQDEHFKHLEENPTYIRPQDWREVDELIDWAKADREEPLRLPDGELGAAPAGDEGLHAHGFRREPEGAGLVRGWQQRKRRGYQTTGFHGRRRTGA